jgi:anti-sigma regulatory factor (Ser/Thr protein kinase)
MPDAPLRVAVPKAHGSDAMRRWTLATTAEAPHLVTQTSHDDGGGERATHVLELPGGTSAPAAARQGVGKLIGTRLPRQRAQDALLLVTELVTNAVVHGGCHTAEVPVRVRVDLADERARLEVCDCGPGFARPEIPAPRPQGGGMGLMLVNVISAAWGVRIDGGACVWFELAAG